MSSELRVDKIVPVDGDTTGGGGGVIQDKTSTHYNGYIGNIGGMTQCVFAYKFCATITPKFSTSKILFKHFKLFFHK